MKSFYGNFDNLRPHQLKIIGDLAHPTDENNEYKMVEDAGQFITMDKTLRKGKSLVLLKKFRKLMMTIQEKIQSLRAIG